MLWTRPCHLKTSMRKWRSSSLDSSTKNSENHKRTNIRNKGILRIWMTPKPYSRISNTGIVSIDCHQTRRTPCRTSSYTTMLIISSLEKTESSIAWTWVLLKISMVIRELCLRVTSCLLSASKVASLNSRWFRIILLAVSNKQPTLNNRNPIYLPRLRSIIIRAWIPSIG